jgi:hypothetical protein
MAIAKKMSMEYFSMVKKTWFFQKSIKKRRRGILDNVFG